MANAQAQTRESGADSALTIIHTDRSFRGSIPDSSVESIWKVARFDGRTRIVAWRRPGGAWFRAASSARLTRRTAEELREAGVAEIVLRRRLRRASFSLAWLTRH